MSGKQVEKSKKTNLTDQREEEFNNHKHFVIGVTPECTRKDNANWKKGVYLITMKAHVQIVLAYIDDQHKEVGFGRIIEPTGDVDADMNIIKSYYAGVSGKIPRNFAI